MLAVDRGKAWAQTARSAALLCLAMIVVAVVPFRFWQDRIGGGPSERSDPAAARRLAASIERAAHRLPFRVKCLPRALALGLILQRRGLAHRIVLAVRPQALRGHDDDLHAWVEVEEAVVLGDLPGPWIEVLAKPPRVENLALGTEIVS
ncbi:transglutaminase superfamily protein [Novosphingobium kunmingense]|uniref:Transglutaminase superfamily protein n=1 Tax=Novosphingobium kunmingense TaxID=1211806 RepID=A0A2N0H5E6_9SPHN|nr:lasso peptide biosynthesis B2 protein [Novosphingobium kunmingense]PKB14153.1 transglutaminase superfamily protein [Novosphingobium kunmingense]